MRKTIISTEVSCKPKTKAMEAIPKTPQTKHPLEGPLHWTPSTGLGGSEPNDPKAWPQVLEPQRELFQLRRSPNRLGCASLGRVGLALRGGKLVAAEILEPCGTVLFVHG